MPAAARPEPEIASAMPAQPQWNSSAEITDIWPSGSAAERWMPSRPPKPCLRASLMTSQGMLSSSSCLRRRRADHLAGEGPAALLVLLLLLVECEIQFRSPYASSTFAPGDVD